MKDNTKRQVQSYILWGMLPTAINYIVYLLCRDVIHIHYAVGNVIAWLIAVLFSFYLNKRFVFQSKSWAGRIVLKELAQFMVARIFSVAAETGLLFLLVEQLHLDDRVTKVVVNILIIVANFFIGKLIIFKKKPAGQDDEVQS